MNDAGFAISFFDGLDADAGVLELPVFLAGAGVKQLQCSDAAFHGLETLIDQVSHEFHVAGPDFEQGTEVMRSDGADEVERAAVAVEEPGRP